MCSGEVLLVSVWIMTRPVLGRAAYPSRSPKTALTPMSCVLHYALAQRKVSAALSLWRFELAGRYSLSIGGAARGDDRRTSFYHQPEAPQSSVITKLAGRLPPSVSMRPHHAREQAHHDVRSITGHLSGALQALLLNLPDLFIDKPSALRSRHHSTSAFQRLVVLKLPVFFTTTTNADMKTMARPTPTRAMCAKTAGVFPQRGDGPGKGGRARRITSQQAMKTTLIPTDRWQNGRDCCS